MLSNPQFQIASQLLIGLMAQPRSGQIGNRVEDVRHALAVSAELIRQWQGDHLPACAYTPPAPSTPAQTGTRTREAVVDRSFISPEEWRRKRAGQGTTDPAARKPGPTVH